MKSRIIFSLVLIVVFQLSSCQSTNPSEPTGTSSTLTQTLELATNTQETEMLYDQSSTFVLSVEESAYPVNISYIDVNVTATEAGCELTISNSYKIYKLNDSGQTFVCYGGVETATVFTPVDQSSMAQGTLRVDFDALRKNNSVHLETGTYRIFFDEQYVDVVLTED